MTAIKGLSYTASSLDDLVARQQEYITSITERNQFDKLLKSSADPIIKGFLYNKFLLATSKNISIEYEVSQFAEPDAIPICEQIELMGVLIDNAIEALEDRSTRKLIVRISKNENDTSVISIANNSDKMKNSEIEQMIQKGYSTKGELRGVGLSRVRDIVSQHNMSFSIDNIKRNNENFLRFSVML